VQTTVAHILAGLRQELAANDTYLAALARRAGYSVPDVCGIVQQAAPLRRTTPWWVWADLVVMTPWVARPYRRRWWPKDG
jgi:hypothetical protein